MPLQNLGPNNHTGCGVFCSSSIMVVGSSGGCSPNYQAAIRRLAGSPKASNMGLLGTRPYVVWRLHAVLVYEFLQEFGADQTGRAVFSGSFVGDLAATRANIKIQESRAR